MGAQMKRHCSLVRYANQARKASVNMLRAIHQLRRSGATCRSCPLQASCAQPAAFNAEMDVLIAEINDQWQSSENPGAPCQRHPKPVEREWFTDGRG